jgi:hypothetical protein
MAYVRGMPGPPIVVAETASYLAWTRKVLDNEEIDEIVDLLAEHPTRGVLIRGTGGVRKVRYAPEGRGSAAVCGASATSTARSCRSTSSPASPRSRRTT